MQGIVDAGPRVRATATGAAMVDFRTCTCGSYADKRKDHHPDCQVEVVLDPTPVIAAIKEMRLNDGHLSQLREQAIPPDQSADVEMAFEYVKNLHVRNEELSAVNRVLTLDNSDLRQRVAELAAELAAEPAHLG